MLDFISTETFNSLLHHIIFIGAVFIPPLFWLWYFRFHDCRRPEPLALLAKMFLASSVGCLILRAFLHVAGLGYVYKFFEINPVGILDKAILFIFILALVEEVIKFVVLRGYGFHQPDFDERIDGIIYGITVGLGFATCENIVYIFAYGPEVVFSRFATATLLHAVLGGIMGSFLAKEKFQFFKKCCLSAQALILSVLFHFIYNVFGVYDLTGMDIKGEVFWVFGLFILLTIIIIFTKKKDRSCRIQKFYSNKKAP